MTATRDKSGGAFFIADFSPDDASEIANRLAARDFLIKPLQDPGLGRGYVRVATALPDDNQRSLAALAEVLRHGEDRTV